MCAYYALLGGSQNETIQHFTVLRLGKTSTLVGQLNGSWCQPPPHSTRSTMDTTTAALDALQTIIDRRIARHEQRKGTLDPKRRQRIRTTLAAYRHCVLTLATKTMSLQTATRLLFGSIWNDLVSKLAQADKDHLSTLLSHFFAALLRLHDGLILIVSGECRHAGDLKTAQSTRFRSHLPQAGVREDGYTKLYQREYSGAAWDELNNETVGLHKVRLPAALKPLWGSNVWTKLDEAGAGAIELELTRLENISSSIQQDFRTFVARARSDLQRVLSRCHASVKVELSLEDKLERLKIVMGRQVMEWKRFGGDFEIGDDQGVLPGLDANGWRRLLQPPAPRKRRRIIAESDEDDDEAKPIVPPKPVPKKDSGLVVRNETKAATSSTTSSLHAIKKDCGVDVEALASGHETLQAEEDEGRRDAEAIDAEHERDELLGKVSQQTRVLKKLLLRSADDLEIWDARELLREAAMQAGNYCLWSNHETNTSRLESIDMAVDYFERSQRLVLAQQELHQTMFQTNDDMGLLLRRNLMLLLGQAHLNAGIARMETSRFLGRRSAECKMLLRLATKDLRVAREQAEAMLKQSEMDQHVGANLLDTTLDRLKAQELKALALRWKITLSWMKGKRAESMHSLNELSDLAKDPCYLDLIEHDDELLVVKLKVVAESYHAGTVLADLAKDLLLDASSVSIREAPMAYDTHLTTVGQAIQVAAGASEALRQLAVATHTDFLEENGILTNDELTDQLKELKGWWQQRTDSGARRVDGATRPVLQGRGEVETPRIEVGPAPPRRFVVVEGDRSRRRHKKPTKGGAGPGNIGLPVTDSPTRNATKPTRQYRKWGDELLPQIIDENGRSVPKIVYPAVAPPMPPEIKAILNANRRVHLLD